MDPDSLKHRFPGFLATGLMLIATGLWTFWGFMEMYYEGWGQPFPYPLLYLTVAGVFLAFWVMAELWPRAGGWLIIVAGALFTAWVLSLQYRRGSPSLLGLLSWFPVTAMVVLVGGFFVAEGRRRQARRREIRRRQARPRREEEVEEAPGTRTGRGNTLRLLLPPGTFVVVGLVCTAMNLHVFTRTDDGDRSQRLIQGNGVSLIWAPAGPGWAQSREGIPRNLSWNQIALYGMEPVGFEEKPGYEDKDATQADMNRYGLFRYLSADGRALEAEPLDLWRMPTVEEIVRSLVRNGKNAGCALPGGLERGRAQCRIRPDKETPLWAPDLPFIYLWAAQEEDSARAYYVGYSGAVSHQPKSWGNPRHGHRFVREPEAGQAVGGGGE